MVTAVATHRLIGQLIDVQGQVIGSAFPVRLTVADPVVNGAAANNEEEIYINMDRSGLITAMRLSMDGDAVLEMGLVQQSRVVKGDTVTFSPGSLSITFTGMLAAQHIEEVVRASHDHADVYVIDEEPSLDD